MGWLAHNWMMLAAFALWMHLVGSICHRRGHQVGWWRGYLARKNESYPDEFWPEDITEEEAYERAKMVKGP